MNKHAAPFKDERTSDSREVDMGEITRKHGNMNEFVSHHILLKVRILSKRRPIGKQNTSLVVASTWYTGKFLRACDKRRRKQGR